MDTAQIQEAELEARNLYISNLKQVVEESRTTLEAMAHPGWQLIINKLQVRLDNLTEGDLMNAKDPYHVFDVRGEIRGLRNLIKLSDAIRDEGEDAARQLAALHSQDQE